jgi:hypothetical protein
MEKTTKLVSDSALVATQIVYIDNYSTGAVGVFVPHDNGSRVLDTNGVLQNPHSPSVIENYGRISTMSSKILLAMRCQSLRAYGVIDG